MKAQAHELARDVRTLVHRRRHDVLVLAGPDLATQRELFDFIVGGEPQLAAAQLLTLRHHLGGSYLDLLRLFLNHRRFMRSRRDERQGKSPRELMTSQGHPHWLTLLGLGPLQPQRA